MSYWEDQFANHPFHATLATLETFLNTDGLVGEDPIIINSFDRINSGVIYIHQQTKNLDKAIVATGWLDALNNHLTKLQAELTAYLNNKNIAHLTNGNANLDAATRQAFLLPKILIPEDLETLSKPLEEYRNLAEKSLDFFKN